MKFLLCLIALAVAAQAIPFEKTDDDYNLDEILPNRRLLVSYIKCALETGKCTADAKDLRQNVRKALTLDCAECNEKQKNDTRRIFKHLIENEKDYWTQIVNKYDTDRNVAPKYEKEFGF